MTATEWVFDKKNFTGTAKTFLTNGICPITKKTKAEFIAEGYTVVSDDDYFSYLEEWENKNLIGKWKEITEEEYDDALNVLPPVAWCDGGFFISERYTSNISDFYQKYDGKYYTSLQRWSTKRENIIKSLLEFIEKLAS